jgi:trehalose 6-phosphate phosphatase
MRAAMYVGDDRTDLDAFATLRRLVAAGELGSALCVGVRSNETPPELEREADVLVDGPPGVRELLEALAG